MDCVCCSSIRDGPQRQWKGKSPQQVELWAGHQFMTLGSWIWNACRCVGSGQRPGCMVKVLKWKELEDEEEDLDKGHVGRNSGVGTEWRFLYHLLTPTGTFLTKRDTEHKADKIRQPASPRFHPELSAWWTPYIITSDQGTHLTVKDVERGPVDGIQWSHHISHHPMEAHPTERRGQPFHGTLKHELARHWKDGHTPQHSTLINQRPLDGSGIPRRRTYGLRRLGLEARKALLNDHHQQPRGTLCFPFCTNGHCRAGGLKWDTHLLGIRQRSHWTASSGCHHGTLDSRYYGTENGKRNLHTGRGNWLQPAGRGKTVFMQRRQKEPRWSIQDPCTCNPTWRFLLGGDR